MDYTIEEKAMFMREALKEAEIAFAHDEIPIGCVLVKRRSDYRADIMHVGGIATSGHACGNHGDRGGANQHENSWRLLDTTLLSPLSPVLCVVVPLD